MLLPVASLSFPFPLPCSFSAVWQAEKDKILKLSAEILRLEKAVQEEKTQNQVFKTELAREKDSSLVRLAATRSRVLRPPAAASPGAALGVGSAVPGAHFRAGWHVRCTGPTARWFETYNVPFCPQDIFWASWGRLRREL